MTKEKGNVSTKPISKENFKFRFFIFWGNQNRKLDWQAQGKKKPTILCNLSYKLNRKSKKSELID